MATDLNLQVAGIKDDYKYGFHDSEENYAFKSGKGLTREIVCEISEMKNEPQWIATTASRHWRSSGRSRPHLGRGPVALELRRHPLLHEGRRPPGEELDDVPAEIKNTFEKLGIPEAEAVPRRSRAQYESEVVYQSLAKTCRRRGCSSSIPTRRCASTPTW